MNEKVIEFEAGSKGEMDEKFNAIEGLAKCLKTKVSIEMVQLVRIRYEASQVELEGVLKALSGKLPKEEEGNHFERRIRGPGRPKKEAVKKEKTQRPYHKTMGREEKIEPLRPEEVYENL